MGCPRVRGVGLGVTHSQTPGAEAEGLGLCWQQGGVQGGIAHSEVQGGCSGAMWVQCSALLWISLVEVLRSVDGPP